MACRADLQRQILQLAKSLDYGEVDVGGVARIEDNSFVAFCSLDDRPLDNLTLWQTEVREIIDKFVKAVDRRHAGTSTRREGVQVFGNGLLHEADTGLCRRGDWVSRFCDCDAAVIVHADETSNPNSSCALVGRVDIPDIRGRKG